MVGIHAAEYEIQEKTTNEAVLLINRRNIIPIDEQNEMRRSIGRAASAEKESQQYFNILPAVSILNYSAYMLLSFLIMCDHPCTSIPTMREVTLYYTCLS